MNEKTLALYRTKVASIERKELEEIAAIALYHLQVVSGSRNSFSNMIVPPEREDILNKMHMEAAEFSISHQV